MKPNGSPSATSALATTGSERSLLTVEEVATLLKVPPSWVYDHTRRRAGDRIPGFRLGKYWRFREADVMAWIERQRAGVTPDA
jgi:excisionase family DNA binding protein